MKRLIFIALSLSLMAGCVTQEKCQRLFPPDTITEVEYITNTIYRDTIIEKYLPGDTIYQSDTILIEGDKVILRPVHARTQLAEARAWVDNNRLRLRLIQYDSILQFKLDSVIKHTADTVIVTKTKTHDVEVDKPLWKYPVLWILGFMFFIIVLLFLREMFR